VDVNFLNVCEGWRTEPALDLRSFLGKHFFGFVKADGVENEAAGRTMVVGEDLADNGDELELVGAEIVVGFEVERGRAPEWEPTAREDLRAGAVLGGEEEMMLPRTSSGRLLMRSSSVVRSAGLTRSPSRLRFRGLPPVVPLEPRAMATDAAAAAAAAFFFFMSSGWRGAELWNKVGNFEGFESRDELLQRWAAFKVEEGSRRRFEL
jgi:hypothetical protein